MQGRSHPGNARARAWVVSVLAGLTVAACSSTTSGQPTIGTGSAGSTGSAASSVSGQSVSPFPTGESSTQSTSEQPTAGTDSTAPQTTVTVTTTSNRPPATTSAPSTTVPNPGAPVAVDDTTIAPFVGNGQTDTQRIVISQLGVVFVNSANGVVVLQAKTITGTSLSAKVTYTTSSQFAKDSMQTIAVSADSIKLGPVTVPWHQTPFRPADIKQYLGDWSGHSRSASVTADGNVTISMRDYSKAFDAPPMVTHGVLVPYGGGSWQLRVYLSDNPDLPIAQPYLVTFSADVLSFGDLTFCGANAAVGACGA